MHHEMRRVITLILRVILYCDEHPSAYLVKFQYSELIAQHNSWLCDEAMRVYTAV